jgi:hypothetical protein
MSAKWKGEYLKGQLTDEDMLSLVERANRTGKTIPYYIVHSKGLSKLFLGPDSHLFDGRIGPIYDTADLRGGGEIFLTNPKVFRFSNYWFAYAANFKISGGTDAELAELT